MLKYMTAHGWC